MRIYGNQSIQDFREEQKREYTERLQRQRRMDQEQRERTAAAEAAAKGPIHEQMQKQAAEIRNRAAEIQAGTPGAFSELRACFLRSLDIISYILETTNTAAGSEREAHAGQSEE